MTEARHRSPRGRWIWATLALALAACDDPRTAPRARSPDTEATPAQASPSIRWRLVDVAPSVGADVPSAFSPGSELHLWETMGGGVAWIDFDSDGDPDLFVPRPGPVDGEGRALGPGASRLLQNDGGRFVDVTEAAGVSGRGYALGATVGDIDDDGAPDLVVTCFGPDLLFRNRGDGSFEELELPGQDEVDPFSAGAALADFDGDGRVDLWIAKYLRYDPARAPRCTERGPDGAEHPIYCGPRVFDGAPDRVYRNLGGGRFVDVSRDWGVGLGATADSKSLGVLATDLDDDGDVDVYVACDTTPNLLWRNRGDGSFEEVGLETGVAASPSGQDEGAMGIAAGDVDDDGGVDLLVTNFRAEPNRLWLRTTAGTWRDASARLGFGLGTRPRVGWGVVLTDLDLDGVDEVAVTNGHIYHNAERWMAGESWRQPMQLLARDGGRFHDVTLDSGDGPSTPSAGRGLAAADFDGDGDADLAVVSLDRPLRLLRADGGGGAWFAVRLIGSGAGGRDAIGARVDLVTEARTRTLWRVSGGSYLSANESLLRFGVAPDDPPRALVVHWPGGGTTRVDAPPSDRVLVVRR